jgi:hypothetical protein
VIRREDSSIFPSRSPKPWSQPSNTAKSIFIRQKRAASPSTFRRRTASFTFEDEGEGFDVAKIPDPRDPDNLFKTSGRGVLIIHNVMDAVQYNERGNRITMIKKTEKEKAEN